MGRVIRRKIVRSDTYALLIGNDTYTKTTYVKWEVEVAMEEGCRLIGVNLNNCRFKDWSARGSSPTKAHCLCPSLRALRVFAVSLSFRRGRLTPPIASLGGAD